MLVTVTSVIHLKFKFHPASSTSLFNPIAKVLKLRQLIYESQEQSLEDGLVNRKTGKVILEQVKPERNVRSRW